MNTRFFTALGGSIDKERGIISGVSVVTIGEAEGHGLKIDPVTLGQVKTAAEAHPSVQVKIDHWSGFEGIVGTLQNFSIDGNRLRADLHLLDNHPARARVLEMAEKMPGGFGLSIVFIGDSETINGEAFARCNELFSVDLVDRPAANPTGLFSSGNAELIELRRVHLAEIETYRVRIHILELKALEREAALIEAQRKVELLTRRCEQITRDREMMASRMAAEIVASTGTRMPAAISAKGDERPRSNLSGLDLAKAANTNRHNKQNP